MRLFKNPEWIAEFKYEYQSFDEIPQQDFDNINGYLASVVGPNPLVSIIIPAWNEEVNILRCIATLGRTKANFPIEIIVVNNNSTDGTQKTLDKLNVIRLFEKKQGGGPARQLGQEHAKGKYILLADADCLYPSCWVEEMVTTLSRSDVVCVYGRYSFISETAFPRWKLFLLETMKDLIAEVRHVNRPYYNTYGLSMGYIRELGIKIGFVETNFWGEDGQLALNLMRYGKIKQMKKAKARVWTGPRTLQRDGSLGKVFAVRIVRELKRFTKNFNNRLPEDAVQKSKGINDEMSRP